MRGKTASFTIAILMLVFLLAVSVEPIGVKTAKADDEAFIVWRSTGGASWYQTNGWPNETNEAEDVAHYVYSSSAGLSYELRLCARYGITESMILNVIELVDQCDNVIDNVDVFVYAHGTTYIEYGYLTWLPEIENEPIPVTKYMFYDCLGYYGPQVKDKEIFYKATGGIHHFVFMWTCAAGTEIGYYDDYWSDGDEHFYIGTGPLGMPYAWTRQDNTTLSADGYASPDSTDYCFIGFEGWSKPLSEDATETMNYGDFVKYFYQRALQYNRSIKNALDDASDYVWGQDFDETILYNGYTDYVPGFGNQYGQMHVYGNGNNEIPSGE